MTALSIDRVDGLSPEEFHRGFLLSEKPVILTGIASRWRAAAAWTPEYFKTKYPDLLVPYELWARADDGGQDNAFDYDARKTCRQATMSEFVDLLRSDNGTIYSTMFRIFDALPELLHDIEPIDPYMGLSPLYPAALRNRLVLKPNLWTGPGGTLTVLHFDRAHNLYVQLYGRKKWIFFAPDVHEPLYWPCNDLRPDMLQFSPVNAAKPDLERFPQFEAATPIEIVIEPGEILFVPTGWWHQVYSLEPSISLNYFWFAPWRSLVALRHYFYHWISLSLKQGARRLLARG